MSLKPQASFSSGELDPALQERTTLAKFKSGLNTGRNAHVTRGGSLITRIARKHVVKTKLDSRLVKCYCPPGSIALIEWGHEYVRVYNQETGALVGEVAHDWTEDDIPHIIFTDSGDYLYAFRYSKIFKKFNYITGQFVSDIDLLALPPAPTNFTALSGTGTGYDVDYLITYMKNGEESEGVQLFGSSSSLKTIINAGEANALRVQVQTGFAPSGITEIRVYRRPAGAGAYGFVGASSFFDVVTGNLCAFWTDIGGEADYTHQPPSSLKNKDGLLPILFVPRVGVVYQQRLLMTEAIDLEAIYASRPGFQNNFFRDYPLSSDSALKFKSGTSGKANVMFMLDADGLVVFTTIGIFTNVGSLSPTNLALDKKGAWKIDQDIPPLAVPGGVFFVDSATNTVRNLVWSNELASYNAADVSIFSNHLFLRKKIKTWAFQTGKVPVLWVTFDDGTFASFTYEFDQEMRAWTRHDSELFVEQVIGTSNADRTYFVTRDGNKRYIEVTIPRYVSATELSENPQADKNESMALMDGITSYDGRLNGDLAGDDVFTLTPVTPGEWDGPLTLTCGTSGIFTDPGAGKVGEVLRVFNDEDKTSIDLEVTARASNNSITVEPKYTYPSDEASGFSLYLTITGLTDLSHLRGANVGIIVDGYVVATPKNDDQNYPVVVVDDTGSFTIPNNRRAAILHVGRTFVWDIETLDIDTVEQKPTVVEEVNVNKLYLTSIRSNHGIYIGNRFKPDDSVKGMERLSVYDVDYSQENPIIGNRYPQPSLKKHTEISLPGDWKSNGRIAIRGADPVHCEILSIITDSEVNWRSDR